MAVPALHACIWRNLRLVHPADWELLQFTRNPERGRCVFADRYRFRLELHWRMVPGSPEIDLLWRHYRGRLEEQGWQELRSADAFGWKGWSGSIPGAAVARYGRYEPAERCLVELVLVWPEGEDVALRDAVLSGTTVEPPGPEGVRRWRAFGIDASVPPRARLTACDVRPGTALLDFRDAGGRARWRFERRVRPAAGAAPGAAEGRLAEWAAAELANETGGGRTRAGSHEVFWRTGRLRASGWLARRLWGRAEAWTCPADGRVHAVFTSGPRPPAPPASLTCAACRPV